MRSSIACIRCRRSKIKCVNSGVGTTCRACTNSDRECTYPAPVEGAPRRRTSISGRADGGGDGDRRQRQRKSGNAFAGSSSAALGESPRPQLDALNPRLLTPQVWQELFDIFQIHYSADLPFLHPPTFLKPIRQAGRQDQSSLTPTETTVHARPPASDAFLLAFLALTSRFHPKIVAHHSPPTSARQSNPLIASEYYAAAASERLASAWTDCSGPNIDRTQAMLMIGLHAWGMCRGAKAWLAVGNAIRSAQAMGLQYEMDLDDEPLSRSVALRCEAERLGLDRSELDPDGKDDGDKFIQQEIRRRTFWSCFIMDRYLSSGKYRPQMLHAADLRIQLPASERSFLFAEKVRTLMLGEEDNRVARADVQSHRQASVMLGTTGTPEPKTASSPKSAAMTEFGDESAHLEYGAEEGLVSRYIKILEIYGKVIKWSCAGGRRTEEHPPWDPECKFYQLRKECQNFKISLPRQHALTPQNTQAHITLKTSTPYTLVHTVYSLAQIVLHREYVPFLPLRCSKPEGPLDPPLFPADKYEVPPGFWEQSARECFKAARDVMDLVRSCQEWNALVETPIVGFTIYTVAFVGVYCINFPWMDPDGFMCTKVGPETQSRASGGKMGESRGFQAARKALEMVVQMRPRLQMADGWFKTINRCHMYMRRMRRDYRKNTASAEGTSESDGSPISTRHLSLREGGSGGGLDEYKLLERTLKEFGNLEDQDVDMRDADQPAGSRTFDAVYDDSGSGTTVKSEEADHRNANGGDLRQAERGPWNAINATAGAAKPREETSTPNNGQFRSYESYHQPQQPYQHPSTTQYPQPPHQHLPYPQQPINGFRASYPPHDLATATGHPPSLQSPTSHSATTPSEPSPGYQRPPQQQQLPPHQQQPPQQQPYSAWPHHSPALAYQMQPPAAPFPNDTSQSPQYSSAPAYPTHAQRGTPQQMQPPPPMQEQTPSTQPWRPVEKGAWLDSLDTRLGGDDVAAFVDGGDFAEWAQLSSTRTLGGGWLSQVWGTPGVH